MFELGTSTFKTSAPHKMAGRKWKCKDKPQTGKKYYQHISDKTLTITDRTNTNYKNEQTFNQSYTEIVYPLKDAQYHLLFGKWKLKPQCDITTYSLEH